VGDIDGDAVDDLSDIEGALVELGSSGETWAKTAGCSYGHAKGCGMAARQPRRATIRMAAMLVREENDKPCRVAGPRGYIS